MNVKQSITGILSLLIIVSLPIKADSLIDIDFTRDSTLWNAAFPQMTWNANGKDFMIGQLNNYKANDCFFKGAYGRFYGNDPYDVENQCKVYTYSFRIANTGNSYIELPEIQYAKDITIHCRSGNTNQPADFAIEKLNGSQWELISNMSCPANENSDHDEVIRKNLNINKPVKLRLYGASKNLHIYTVQVTGFGETAVRGINENPGFDLWIWDNVLHVDNQQGENVNLYIMDMVGKIVYNTILNQSADMQIKYNQGCYIVKAINGQKMITKKIIIK